MPVFEELKEDNSISLNLTAFKRRKAYEKLLGELEKILPTAAKSYDLDLLDYIYLGRLMTLGDMAVTITNQYNEAFGEESTIPVADYPKIEQLLLESPLASDLNKVLEPYGVSIDNFHIEKVIFITKEQLFEENKVETDSHKVPAHLLDCMIGIKVKGE